MLDGACRKGFPETCLVTLQETRSIVVWTQEGTRPSSPTLKSVCVCVGGRYVFLPTFLDKNVEKAVDHIFSFLCCPTMCLYVLSSVV